MASEQKSRSAPRKIPKGDNPLAQLGLLSLPSVDIGNIEHGSDVDEGELESELEALLSGKAISKPRQKKKPTSKFDIEKLAADCLKDSDGDDDETNLSDDEELLAELIALSPEPAADNSGAVTFSTVAILEERLRLYQQAVENSDGSTKSHRFGRALRTLQDLLKSAKSGIQICEDDIPPMINLPKQTISKIKELPIHGQLVTRRDEYKMAALKAKKSGNTEAALMYVRIAKKFDAVIEAEKAGQAIDLSNMPPPPNYLEEKQISSLKYDTERKISQEISAMEAAALAAASEPEDPAMFAAPPPPSSVHEALRQRLDKYICTRDSAQAEGNNVKFRRLQRIIKQYDVAVKNFTAGKAVDFDELPNPPGFAPIPKDLSQPNPTIKTVETAPEVKQTTAASNLEVVHAAKQKVSLATEKKFVSNSETKGIPSERIEKLRKADTSTVLDKQLDFLLDRQKLFRQAAIASKKNGDIQQAKEYLRMSKGFDSMIEASKSGLPIDATTIPTPPQLKTDFVIIETSESIAYQACDQAKLFESLECDLTHQIEVCTKNKDHFLRLGDVSSASKFEKLGLESRKDLSLIQHLKKNGDQLPQFHYETRLFSMVQCHSDLGDNDLEVTVERGINFPAKTDELDSYVRLEFPIPPETPQQTKTRTIRNTNNPIFQEEFKFKINRKSRSQVRHFKRQLLKLEVFSKGGFLRSDALLGIVSIKLVELESKCVIHDSFNLMDGRRACGGKLEVKIRIRDPLFVKQVEEVQEKWLVIGS